MDRMDYDEYAFLKQLLDEYDKEPEEPTMEKCIKSLVKAVKQKAVYKNRWQTAIRDLILGGKDAIQKGRSCGAARKAAQNRQKENRPLAEGVGEVWQ